MKRILVVGAGRPLGAGIALRLSKAGHGVTATRFQRMDHDRELEAAGAGLAALDVRDLEAVASLAEGHDAAVLVPILSVSGPAAQVLAGAGIERGVAFSSNNVAVAPDAPVYHALAAAECDLLDQAPGWAILRPTMIYGHLGADAIAGLMRRVARWPVLPVPGDGKALQQPVHIDDLEGIVLALVSGAWPASGVLPVGGAQVLSQAELVVRAYGALGQRPRMVMLPLGPVRLAARLGLPLPLDRHQLARIERDKHVAEPVDIPQACRPRTDLDAALADMALRLGLTPPGR